MNINLQIICNHCGEEKEISSINANDQLKVFVNPCKECERT